MPRQVSKTISAIIFDEEVQAWQILEAYLLKTKEGQLGIFGVKKISSRRMCRELLRLAAEHLKTEIGPEVAQKLAAPPALSDFLVRRSNAIQKAKLAMKGRKPKPVKKVASEPPPRTVWNRPWKRRPGDLE